MAKSNIIGGWAFVIGIVIAILIGIGVPLTDTVIAILVVLGIIIGLLNIASKHVQPFMLASIAVLLASYMGKAVLGMVPYVKLGSALDAITALVVPAIIIVALKEVFEIAKK
jgi:hypothetical protein